LLVPAAAVVAPAEPDLREQARPSARRAANEMGVSDAIVGIGTDWQASDLGAAAALLGRPLATVEGLAVLHVETGTVGDLPAVRVTQAIDLDSLTVTQYSVAEGDTYQTEAERLDAAPLHVLQVRRDGFIVVLQGPVSRDSLLRLADRIP
jgi:hypothetical protein